MSINIDNYHQLSEEAGKNVTLVAVSKFKPTTDILALYQEGQLDFGENYVQELVEKYAALPKDIRWHFIGHLQSNKVKYIAPFVYLIQGVDSLRLLAEINKQAKKNNRVIAVLLQVHIASEETKFGMDREELDQVIQELQAHPGEWTGVQVRGLMGMASFTGDETQVKKEFLHLSSLYHTYTDLHTPVIDFTFLSMGMSADYRLAIECGSNMIRVGSLLFGSRS